MTEAPSPRVITWPSDEEAREAFNAYTNAVGRVAYATNYLQEKLCRIFVFTTGTSEPLALAIWYTIESDRLQIKMLESSINAAPMDRWPPRLPAVKKDLLWLLKQARNILDRRNDAIHAPCVLVTGTKYSHDAVMAAEYFAAHPRAKKMVGWKLIDEFTLVEKHIEQLSRFAVATMAAMLSEQLQWPDRPPLPLLSPK